MEAFSRDSDRLVVEQNVEFQIVLLERRIYSAKKQVDAALAQKVAAVPIVIDRADALAPDTSVASALQRGNAQGMT